MAEPVERSEPRADAIYDWDKYADGRMWKFERGKDFLVDPKSFSNAARKAVNARRDRVSDVNIKIRQGTVFVRFNLKKGVNEDD
ncbi:MAG TPA: hypothetical protein VLT90_13125 [Terriglobales bacterium]|nr:hypothetical protein [Terriglobales bacterium]